MRAPIFDTSYAHANDIDGGTDNSGACNDICVVDLASSSAV